MCAAAHEGFFIFDLPTLLTRVVREGVFFEVNQSPSNLRAERASAALSWAQCSEATVMPARFQSGQVARSALRRSTPSQ
jgi:hypothetical protein